MQLVEIEAVQEAASLLDGKIVKTPTINPTALSALLDVDVFLKLETMQRTGSFKDRGAYIKLLSLTEQQRKNGVIAVSAGNHAQGVAYHSQNMGIPATIIMPHNTPLTKIMKTEQFGAKVILHGYNLNEGEPLAYEMAEKHNYSFISPYDDPKVIAGQGTVGLEMLEAVPDLDTIIVPIGGGGLIAGVALAAKSINPKIQIVGVEAALYPSMYQLLNNITPNMGGNTIAEGIAVKTPGAINQAMTKKYVDELLQVKEGYLEQAVATLVEYARVVAEGAGAAGIAALLQHGKQFKDKKVGVVICGANIDSRVLASLMIRGMIRTHRYLKIEVDTIDAPGYLAIIAKAIADKGGNIIEVNYQHVVNELPIKETKLHIALECRNKEHGDEICAALESLGRPLKNLTILQPL
ncbi:MAG: threonine ammonia-lyase [Alphaproteobacteria bacterium]|nr:threonine ammonia-lyase [Alphaproteobacteria bacterium]